MQHYGLNVKVVSLPCGSFGWGVQWFGTWTPEKEWTRFFFSALVLDQNKDVLTSTLNWRMSLVRDSEHSKGTLGFLK